MDFITTKHTRIFYADSGLMRYWPYAEVERISWHPGVLPQILVREYAQHSQVLSEWHEPRTVEVLHDTYHEDGYYWPQSVIIRLQQATVVEWWMSRVTSQTYDRPLTLLGLLACEAVEFVGQLDLKMAA